MTTVSIRLPDELAAKLVGISKETERSKSFLIQKAIEAYVEEYADLQIALDRLHDTSDATISGKALRESLGL